MTPADELRALDDLTRRLQGRFPDTPLEDLRLNVDDVHRQFDACRVRSFIVVLVEREVLDRLRLLAARAVPAPVAEPTAPPAASRQRSRA